MVEARDLPAKQCTSTLFSGLSLRTVSIHSLASLKNCRIFWLGLSSSGKILYYNFALKRAPMFYAAVSMCVIPLLSRVLS